MARALSWQAAAAAAAVPPPNQRLSFSVRVRNAPVPNTSENLPWLHVDVLAAESLDFRLRQYHVASGTHWRFDTELWLDSVFDSVQSSHEVSDTFEDVYFPVEIPSVACIDLLGCLYAVESITAGYSSVARHALAANFLDGDIVGDTDLIHRKFAKFSNFQPVWRIEVASNPSLSLETLSANSEARFSKTTLVPPVHSRDEPINVLRFVIKSDAIYPASRIKPVARKDSSHLVEDLSSKSLPEPAAKKTRLSLRSASQENTIDHRPIAHRTRKGRGNKTKNGPKLPLDLLPPELIFQIIDSIPGGYFDRIRTLVTLCGVNRRLRSICSTSDLYSVVDLKALYSSSNRLSPQFFDFLAFQRPSHLRISWLPSLGDSRLLKLDRLVQGGNLSTLVAQACPEINDDFLKTLCRSNCDNLTTLDLSSCWSISRRGFGCLDVLTKLKRLSLANTSISQKTLDYLLSKLGSNLEVLNLSGLHEIGNMDIVCDILAYQVPHLKALDMSDTPSLTAVGLGKLAKSCTELEELVLLQCQFFTTLACTEMALRHWRNLRRLFVHVSDVRTLELMAEEGGNKDAKLEQLVIFCLRRPGAPVSVLARLLAAFPKLTYLKVPIEWPTAREFEESRLQLANLRRHYSKCAIQTHS